MQICLGKQQTQHGLFCWLQFVGLAPDDCLHVYMIGLLSHASMSNLDVCIMPNAQSRQDQMGKEVVHMGPNVISWCCAGSNGLLSAGGPAVWLMDLVMTPMGREVKFLMALSLYGLIIVTMVKAQQQQSISGERAQPENHVEVWLGHRHKFTWQHWFFDA